MFTWLAKLFGKKAAETATKTTVREITKDGITTLVKTTVTEAGEQAAKKGILGWTKTAAGYGAAGAGVYVAGKSAYNHAQHPGVMGGAGAQFSDSILKPLEEMGITFGTGSAVGAGLLYAAGHFLLDSPLLGLGLAAVGALAGQPIADAIFKPSTTTVTPPPAAAPQPQVAAAPAQQVQPEITAPKNLPPKPPATQDKTAAPARP